MNYLPGILVNPNFGRVTDLHVGLVKSGCCVSAVPQWVVYCSEWARRYSSCPIWIRLWDSPFFLFFVESKAQRVRCRKKSETLCDQRYRQRLREGLRGLATSARRARARNSVATSTLSSNPWHEIAARGIPHSELTVSFLLKTRRIAESQAHVRRWTHSCFPS
jgi:hypothetical protein